MPIYNNPLLGQAFGNLAELFAPPSGADAAGWATAKARNAETERYSWIFNNPLDPTASERSSLLGIQNYGATPDGFATTNSTLQRGQDLESGDRRYGTDVGASTLRANNAATVAGGIEQQRLSTLGSLFGPVTEGAIRPAVPESVAGLFGAPALPQVEGRAKPMTTDEVVAAAMRDMPGFPEKAARDKFAPTLTQVEGQDRRRLVESGQLSDQQIADLVTGERSPVEAIDPATGRATFMSPGAAVRTGAQPFVKPTADSSTEISRLITERDQLPAGDPNRTAYDQRISALGRGQQQSAYDKTNDESLATLNDTISKAGAAAVGDRATLARLQEAVSNPDTPQGAMAGTNLAMRKVLTAFGIPAGDTSEAEMVQALGNQLSLRLRDPSSGGGMPGSLSDSDREFLKSMAVGLGNSPAANQKLVSYYLRIQQKNIDLDNLRRGYVEKRGRLDEGFRDLAADYLQKTGIYADVTGAASAPPATTAASPAPASAVTAPAATGQMFDTPGGPVRFRRLD